MPLPKGYQLDEAPKLPAGYKLDGEEKVAPVAEASVATPRKEAAIEDRSLAGNYARNTRYVPSNGSETNGSRVQAALQNFGAATAKNLIDPFLHPFDTAKATIQSMATNPYDLVAPAAGIVQDFKENGAGAAIPHLLGAGAAMLLGDKIAAPAAVKMLNGPLSAARVAAKGAGNVAKIASATPESLNLAATRVLAKGTPGEVLGRALKTPQRYGDMASSYEDALKPILDHNPSPQTVRSLGEAADAAGQTNQEQYRSLFDAAKTQTVPGYPFVNAQAASVPTLRAFENPGLASRTRAKAESIYGGRTMGLDTVDQLRVGANQELHSFYNKAGGDRAAALATPETARVKSIGDTARDELYPRLESANSLPEGTVAGQQQMYGKLAEIGDIAGNRAVVAGRHDPISLAEKMATGGHHGGVTSRLLDFAGQKLLRGATDSDALVRSAVDRYQNPGGYLTPLQARPGMLPQAGFRLGSLLNKTPPLALSPSAPSSLFFAPRFPQRIER